MAQINNEKLEEILKNSLKNKSEMIPSEELNTNLKKALQMKANGKTISICYLPLIAALLISILMSCFILLFISSVIIQVLILGSFLFSLINISIFTYLGVKKFELKEGAVIEI
jgi:hypothetical protein